MFKFTTWNGEYRKTYYLALIDGKEVPCWPNAGCMCATDGSGREWKSSDKIKVRRCTWEEHIAASKPAPTRKEDE